MSSGSIWTWAGRDAARANTAAAMCSALRWQVMGTSSVHLLAPLCDERTPVVKRRLQHQDKLHTLQSAMRATLMLVMAAAAASAQTKALDYEFFKTRVQP